ncbi:hypothetical protein FRC02_007417 [Tulasnella sp. 418]|nr:hypothetical protein FRC02_007417 [Tulasnella sp. 418]
MALRTIEPTPPIITLTEPLLKTQCKLGEGPLWDPRTQTLHFLDIDSSKVYHYHEETNTLTVEQYDEPIGCLAIRRKGGLACGAKQGFGILHPSSTPGINSKIDYISRPLPPSHLKNHLENQRARFNDGACDARGRFWSGTLEFTLKDGTYVPGQLWRYDPSTGETVLVDDKDITDSNGIGWNSDSSVMYFTNSSINVIYAYNYDLDTGAATNRRPFIDENIMGLKKELYGNPDGLCIDNKGRIWSARWEASRVVRFTEDGKGIDLEVHIPKAYNVTACCFGGSNLDKLYITTASCHANSYYPPEENETRQTEFFQSGDLFVVDFADSENALKASFTADTGRVEWRYDFLG